MLRVKSLDAPLAFQHPELVLIFPETLELLVLEAAD